MISIAINGFGRIGKNFLRILLADTEARKKIIIRAINVGSADPNTLEYMLRYDTILGTYTGPITYRENILSIDGIDITILAELDAQKLPWKKMGIEYVIDATGHYTHRAAAEQHISSGAQGVIITAPAKNEDCTIIMGINQHIFNREKHKIISLGSCTTNAVVPILHLLDKTAGIISASMTTVHAYTNTQTLLDVNAHAQDMRRSRAAGLNIVPSTTGAMEVVSRVLPQLTGKITGCALRVPVPIVSLVDVACILEKGTTKEEINTIFKTAAHSRELTTILDFSTEPLVSSDYQGNSHSVIIDGLMTLVTNTHVRPYGWYDNEWAYSTRIKDFLWTLL